MFKDINESHHCLLNLEKHFINKGENNIRSSIFNQNVLVISAAGLNLGLAVYRVS